MLIELLEALSTLTKLERGISMTATKSVFSLSPVESPQSSLQMPFLPLQDVPFEQGSITAAARERISWHEKLTGGVAAQKRVHEYVAAGDFESAVTLLLSTSPNEDNFYLDALRAISLASAVSPALHELAVKVVAANMQSREDSLAGTHLLCAVGCYQEACSQLQDAGRWTDASTLAATHLRGSDHARVLERWAEHVLVFEHNLWRAMTLFVAAGALSEALAALRSAQLPETAALFLIACHEAKVKALARTSRVSQQGSEQDNNQGDAGAEPWMLDLPGGLNNQTEGVVAVCEYFGQYQLVLARTVSAIQAVIN